ncbi:MAG: hypothetical protein GXP39_04695 [Chloroflexi bacterium]|nr:hypothetical protein [Chloroflexota bacterium]
MAVWQTFRGVMTLRTETFVSFRDDPGGLRRGIVWLIAVTLIAGSLVFVTDLAQSLRPVEVQIEAMQQGMEEGLRQMQRFMPPGSVPPEVLDQITEGFKVGVKIATEIASLPTILPRPIAAFLESLGEWWSTPFARMGRWLGYALWVMLAAKLLGGRGGLRGFLATTSLYAVPQVITILRPVPFLGALLGWIAAVWGWLIYVKATAVAHGWVETVPTESGEVLERTRWGRAIAAVLLPLLVCVILALLLVMVVVIVIVAVSR